MDRVRRKETDWVLIRYGVLIVLIAAFSIAARCMVAKRPSAGGSWTSAQGDWYYSDGSMTGNRWLPDGYFIDENGKMLTDEWVFFKTDGSLQHAKRIAATEMPEIDMTRLSYVGEDGKRLKNKKIYYTPIEFDQNGICSLSLSELAFIDGTDSGLYGLRRYVITDGGYQEYY